MQLKTWPVHSASWLNDWLQMIPVIEEWWERSPPNNLARVWFRSIAVCGLSFLFVLVLLREFFSGVSGFSPFTKTNISKFQCDQDRGPALKLAKGDVAFSLNIYYYKKI